MSSSRDHEQTTTDGQGNPAIAALAAAIEAAHERCPLYPDFPTAWAIQRWSEGGGNLSHHERCSSVPGWAPISGPGFLCDCGAVVNEWNRRYANLTDGAGNCTASTSDQGCSSREAPSQELGDPDQ